MLDALTWIAVLALGGFVGIAAGAIFIWAIFWIQDGGEE